jgi:hypothetical protein
MQTVIFSAWDLIILGVLIYTGYKIMGIVEDLKAGLDVVASNLSVVDAKLDEVKAKLDSGLVVGEVVTEEQKAELLALVESVKTSSSANVAEVEALLAPVVPVEPVVE